MKNRLSRIGIFSVIAVTMVLALLQASPAMAQSANKGGGNGGGNGGGGVPPAEVIYLVFNGSMTKMNADGSGKTSLPIPVGEPSRIAHGGHRWFVRADTIADEYYPDGSLRSEIFAYRDDGTRIQLTNDTNLQPATGMGAGYGADDVQWLPDDAGISWVARRWDPNSGEITEAGVYASDIQYANNGDIVGLVQLPTRPLVPIDLIEINGQAVPDIGTFSWSPDETRFVFDTRSSGELIIADILQHSFSLLYAGPASDVDWSPDGSTIAFVEAVFLGDILTIKPDGSGLKRILQSRGGGKAESVRLPHWSPTSGQLTYLLTQHGSWLPATYVYRANADGSSKTNLTRESTWSLPAGWR